MEKLKIAVIGATTDQLGTMKKLLEERGMELIDMPLDANVVVDKQWVTTYIRERIPEVLLERSKKYSAKYLDTQDVSRGGSRGKGGKIKYRRN
mgnify:CR=1 FL=1|tara:strand:- start:1420 stop:1698 length:279 start_codon:yes stop_codon:yes gene_type:complete